MNQKRMRGRMVALVFLSATLLVALLVTALNVAVTHILRSRERAALATVLAGDPPPATCPRAFTVPYVNGTPLPSLTYAPDLSPADAVRLAALVRDGGSERGTLEDYRYEVLEESGSPVIAFLDVRADFAFARTLLLSSLIAAASLLLLLFCTLLFTYKRIFHPFLDVAEKQKRFITDASHELKTPLTVISANAELTEMTFGENEFSSAILRQVGKMTDAVRNLTLLSHLDGAGALAEQTTVSLSDVLADLLPTFERNLARGGRTLDATVAEHVSVMGDERLLRELFAILFDNAEKYALTSVTLTLSGTASSAVLVIENDAVGIEDGNLDRVFARFYRSDASRASGLEGSGIGLSIAREIVRRHGGEIHARGASGIFRLRLTL